MEQCRHSLVISGNCRVARRKRRSFNCCCGKTRANSEYTVVGFNVVGLTWLFVGLFVCFTRFVRGFGLNMNVISLRLNLFIGFIAPAIEERAQQRSRGRKVPR